MNGSRQRAVREDSLRNHARLLDAALELFDERGLDVPLREVGERAGVSQAGVFRHFANRDRLIIEVYDRSAATLSDRVIDALVDARDASPAERLDALFDTIVAGVIEHPCYGQLASRGARLYPDRSTDPALLEELGSLIGAAQDVGLLASDIIGLDLVNLSLVAAGMMTSHLASPVVGQRIMTILRRGLTPEAQANAAMPEIPATPHPDHHY